MIIVEDDKNNRFLAILQKSLGYIYTFLYAGFDLVVLKCLSLFTHSTIPQNAAKCSSILILFRIAKGLLLD